MAAIGKSVIAAKTIRIFMSLSPFALNDSRLAAIAYRARFGIFTLKRTRNGLILRRFMRVVRN